MTALTEAINGTGELTLEAWVKPAATVVNQPGGIVTMMADDNNLNLNLRQIPTENGDASRYSVRIRTGGGSQSLHAPVNQLTPNLTHVLYTRASDGLVRLYINGIEVADRQLRANFIPWDPDQPLVLANSPNGDQPWLGEYHFVAIYNRALSFAEISRKFQAGP